MRSYHRIKIEEREKIYKLVQEGYKGSAIAQELGRHRSSISRELKRCVGFELGYLPDRADSIASKLKARRWSLFRNDELKSFVIDKLKEGWSPEQISNRIKHEGSQVFRNRALRVSHETIYKFVYSAEGVKLRLPLLLTRRKLKRTKWYSRRPKKSHIPEEANIKYRPASVDKRKVIGHFEGDLVIFKAIKSANVTTLVERKSRFVDLIYNRGKYTKEVIGNIKQRLQLLPEKHLKSITFDRGTEFASYKDLKLPTYFCDPHAPWQKGSNENFNGRLRRYLPKSFNPDDLSQNLLDNIAAKLNNQPRKCLGFKTPAEVYFNTSYRLVALDP